jgi:hypothetical protein
MKHMTNLNKHLWIRRILFTCLGSLFIWYVVYTRMIIKKLPVILGENVSWLQLLIFSEIFIIFLFLTLFKMRILFRIYYPKKKETHIIPKKIISICLIISNWFVDLFYNILKTTDWVFKQFFISAFGIHWGLITTTIYQKINEINKFDINDVTDDYNWFWIDQKKYRYPVWLFVETPRLIMLAMLCVDVFIYQTLHFFYIFGILVFVPWLFQYYMHLLRMSLREIFEDMREDFEIIDSKSDRVYSAYTFTKLKIMSTCVQYKGLYQFLFDDFSRYSYRLKKSESEIPYEDGEHISKNLIVLCHLYSIHVNLEFFMKNHGLSGRILLPLSYEIVLTLLACSCWGTICYYTLMPQLV